MVADAAAQAVRAERAQARAGGKLGVGATATQAKAHQPFGEREAGADDTSEDSSTREKHAGMVEAEDGAGDATSTSDVEGANTDKPPSRLELCCKQGSRESAARPRTGSLCARVRAPSEKTRLAGPMQETSVSMARP